MVLIMLFLVIFMVVRSLVIVCVMWVFCCIIVLVSSISCVDCGWLILMLMVLFLLSGLNFLCCVGLLFLWVFLMRFLFL